MDVSRVNILKMMSTIMNKKKEKRTILLNFMEGILLYSEKHYVSLFDFDSIYIDNIFMRTNLPFNEIKNKLEEIGNKHINVKVNLVVSVQMFMSLIWNEFVLIYSDY